MAATLYLPTPLRKLTNGKSKVEFSASSVDEMLARAEVEFPGFRDRVMDSDGQMRRFVNFFVNGIDVRTLQGKSTPVNDSDEVSVVPAMAGGAKSG